MKTKIVGILVCMLLVGTVLPVSGNVIKIDKTPLTSINGNILYVGGSGEGNYTTIQDAIDDAVDGDTVFVYSGMYDLDYMIIINKSIGLIGENKVNTIINGSGISIDVSEVDISGFTIQNGIGIIILSASAFEVSNNNSIYGNIFKSNEYFIGLGGVTILVSSYNTVSNNSFFNCGLWVFSYHNFVYNNTVNGKPLVYLADTSDKVVDDAGQVILMGCNNITIENLELFNTNIGIQLLDTINCFISDNVLSNNSLGGISFINSSNNIISGNIILNNGLGLWLTASRYNTISKNSFENNLPNLLFGSSSCNLISYNNFKYVHKIKISNVFSLCSDNKWVGNFWNRPRLLPVLIWSFKTTRFKFIPILPYSLDVEWRPAKEPNDINGAQSDWTELTVTMPRNKIATYNSLFLKFLEQFPILQKILVYIL